LTFSVKLFDLFLLVVVTVNVNHTAETVLYATITD